MRSELPWLEPRSPWQRFGPTLLGMSIIGVGMGGAIRIVKAQDTAAPPPVGPHVAVTVVKQSDDADRSTTQDDSATSRELESLLEQRSKLDARISDLRQRLRSAERARSRVRVETRVVPRIEITPPRVETRAVPRIEISPGSPDWQRAVEDVRQQAREAMQQAREAMQQAQQALREAQRAAARGESGKGAYTVPTPPNPRFNFNYNSDSNTRDYTTRAYKVDPEAMKRLQEQMRSLYSSQDQWAQKWKEMQPQFEQQMREFQQRMQEWQRNFEAQQRAMQRQMQQQYRNNDSYKSGTKSSDWKAKGNQNLREQDDSKSSEDSSRNKAGDNNNDNEPL